MQEVRWSPDWCPASRRSCCKFDSPVMRCCSHGGRHLKALAPPGDGLPGSSAWPSSQGIFKWVSARAMTDSIWCVGLICCSISAAAAARSCPATRLLQLPLCCQCLVAMQLPPCGQCKACSASTKSCLILYHYVLEENKDQMMGQKVHCVSIFLPIKITKSLFSIHFVSSDRSFLHHHATRDPF